MNLTKTDPGHISSKEKKKLYYRKIKPNFFLSGDSDYCNVCSFFFFSQHNFTAHTYHYVSILCYGRDIYL